MAYAELSQFLQTLDLSIRSSDEKTSLFLQDAAGCEKMSKFVQHGFTVKKGALVIKLDPDFEKRLLQVAQDVGAEKVDGAVFFNVSFCIG